MKELIIKVADRVINGRDTDWNMNINHFDWVPGVGLHGIFKAYKYTGDEKYLNFLIDWADRLLPLAYEQKTVNSTAPMLTILELYIITKNESYLKTCLDIAEYIINEAPLTREGGLEHTVTEAVPGFSEQIWADTLFMVCIFLAKLGTVTDKKYLDFAINQLKIHIELLPDKCGLCYHGWNCEEKGYMSAVFWGRANAWIIYSTMEILSLAGDFEDKEAIFDYVRRHAEALKKHQREDGSFGTIIDDITAYSETSATGGIVSGMKKAIDSGIIDTGYIDVCKKGIEYIKTTIADDGSVLKVSTGTPIMKDAEAYKNIPAISPTLYGQTLVICALAEGI